MIRLSGCLRELIPELLKLDMDKRYILELKEPKNQRSLEQNKLLWKLIHLIAKETGTDDMDVYCACLEKADALSEYIMTAHDMEEELRKSFRGVRFMRTKEDNGKTFYIYKVYLGSSKMDTKEMTELIDVTQNLCAELGISYWGFDYE